MVTIIIPVYNGAAFIAETVASVKGQTYPEWECIIVDDGSTDDTAAVVQQCIGSDERFRYIRQQNKGLSGARNTGLEHASGDLIQFLDGDDVLLPEKLEKQVRVMQDGKAVLSYTDYMSGCTDDVYKQGNFYKSPAFTTDHFLEELIERWESLQVIPPHCFLFAASFFREQGIRFDTSLPNHEDFDCWVIILRLHPDVRYVNEKLCIYRITDNSMSKKMRVMGEGFLQVIDKQRRVAGQPAQLRSLLDKKRRDTLKRYNRIDLMTPKDKLLLIGFLFTHYRKRILN